MGADSGKMALMVGGADDAVAACRPVFDTIAGAVTHVGPSGAGHTIKLLHNMVCHSNFFVCVEAGRLAERAGIPLEMAIKVFNAGNARSYISEQRFPNHILSGKFDGRSTVSNLAKDLAMADDFANEFGEANAYTALTASILKTAMERGLAVGGLHAALRAVREPRGGRERLAPVLERHVAPDVMIELLAGKAPACRVFTNLSR